MKETKKKGRNENKEYIGRCLSKRDREFLKDKLEAKNLRKPQKRRK